MSSKGNKRSLAVVGNLTVDEIVSSGATRLTPGGSALFVSGAAVGLGAKVSIISSIGHDYPAKALKWLRYKDIDVTGVRSAGPHSTRFRLSYQMSSRRLRVIHKGGRLPTSLPRGRWAAVHLGPVFGEVFPSMIPVAREHSSLLSLDLQGFLRKRETNGQVKLSSNRLARFLGTVDLVKATLPEVLIQTSTRDALQAANRILRQGPKYVILTLGRRGAVLADRRRGMFRVPAFPEASVVDPTGAGDALVGGWLAIFLATNDPLWAISVGSAVASLFVRRWGLAKFRLSRPELFRRSAWVYNRILRL